MCQDAKPSCQCASLGVLIPGICYSPADNWFTRWEDRVLACPSPVHRQTRMCAGFLSLLLARDLAARAWSNGRGPGCYLWPGILGLVLTFIMVNRLREFSPLVKCVCLSVCPFSICQSLLGDIFSSMQSTKMKYNKRNPTMCFLCVSNGHAFPAWKKTDLRTVLEQWHRLLGNLLIIFELPLKLTYKWFCLDMTPCVRGAGGQHCPVAFLLPPSFMCVHGTELRSPSLCRKNFHVLNHFTGPKCIDMISITVLNLCSAENSTHHSPFPSFIVTPQLSLSTLSLMLCQFWWVRLDDAPLRFTVVFHVSGEMIYFKCCLYLSGLWCHGAI